MGKACLLAVFFLQSTLYSHATDWVDWRSLGPGQLPAQVNGVLRVSIPYRPQPGDNESERFPFGRCQRGVLFCIGLGGASIDAEEKWQVTCSTGKQRASYREKDSVKAITIEGLQCRVRPSGPFVPCMMTMLKQMQPGGEEACSVGPQDDSSSMPQFKLCECPSQINIGELN